MFCITIRRSNPKILFDNILATLYDGASEAH
jgi:hypothetical protein